MNPNQLRQQKAGLVAQANGIMSAAKSANTALTDAQAKQVDDLLNQAEALETQAKGIEASEQAATARTARLNAANADLGAARGRQSAPEPTEDDAPGVKVKAPAFMADPKRGFKNDRDFLMAVFNAPSNPHNIKDERLRAQSSFLRFGATAGSDEQQRGDDPYGGFLVPEGFSPDLKKVGVESNPLLGRTNEVPMQTPIVNIPARVDKNHTTSVTGGLTFVRRLETVSDAATRMQLERIKLEATMLWGISYVTEELLADSPISVASLLANGYADEGASKDFDELLNGTGAGEPEGILNSPAAVTVTAATTAGASFGAKAGTNIVQMRSQCWGYNNAIWIANHELLPVIANAVLTATISSTAYTAAMLFNPSRGEDVPDMLLGRPIFFSEYPQASGTKGDLILVNPTQYLTGTYQPMQSAESIHVRFDRHEHAFKFWKRNAGACWWRSALTPKKGSAQLSPIVLLSAASRTS